MPPDRFLNDTTAAGDEIRERHDWKKAQEQLRAAQAALSELLRVMTVGELAASIAQAIDQPLAGILSNAGTCLRMLAAEPPDLAGARESARRTLRDGNRAAEGIDRLRALFSTHELAPTPVDSGKAAREGFTLSRSETLPVVFVVDDDVSVRESLDLLIRSAGWEPRLFASARDFLARPPVLAPGCLVLDVSLPDLNGLELQERIAANRTALPIIFITGYGDVPTTVRAMKAGAVEFLTKPFADEALLGAIREALDQSRLALDRMTKLEGLRGSYAALSQREREVMALVCAGLLNKQVGGRLGISEITVKAHRGRVMRKMGALSLPQLVTMAARLGLEADAGAPEARG